MRIIPAIDIMNGKCVRLTRGDYSTRKVYSENPLEMAKTFEANGIQYLHLVDLDGARSKHIVNQAVIYEICSKTSLKVDFGGGLKSTDDLKIAFENGAAQVTGGSIAIQNPALFIKWLTLYGAGKIILGADCNNRMVSTQGWLESSELDVVDFIKDFEAKGITYVICTDIARDGMLQGTSNELYAEIMASSKVQLIASGGVSSVQDVLDLKEIGCEGVIIGKAIYEGRITLDQLQKLC